MYAVVATSGRQYRVNPGDRIEVDRLTGEVGSTVVLDNVMMVGQGGDVTVGTPQVAAARVEAKIVSHKRGPKIIIFKHKRRKGYRRKQGHRQDLTALRIMGIYTDTPAPAVEAMETRANCCNNGNVSTALCSTRDVHTDMAAPERQRWHQQRATRRKTQES